MQFSDSSTNLGLVQDVLFRTNTDVNQYPLKDITRYVNEAYNRVANIILKSEGTMQWDDPNHTTIAPKSIDLVSGTASYDVFAAAPTALVDWLTIERVDMLDANGLGVQLSPLDRRNIVGAISEYKKTAGTPNEFDFYGKGITLYPKPNYDKTNGLVVYLDRAPSYFASTDTTKTPGFATTFHSYLSMYAAHQWNIIKKGEMSLQPLLDRMEKEIGAFYSKRSKYAVPVLKRAWNTFK